MKNKKLAKIAVVMAMVAACGFTTGCGMNMQEVLNQAQAQQTQPAPATKESVEPGQVTESTEASVESASAESEAESMTESEAVETEVATETSEAPSQTSSSNLSGEWTDMKFELAGKAYQMPVAYKELEADGWTFDLAEYGYEGGYEMQPGDKVYATINLTNPDYDEDLSLRVGFKNYSDAALDIKECDIWSLELDTCYGHRQLDSYPSMTIGNGLTIGSSKADVEALCGPCADPYVSDSGYVKYSYDVDDYKLKLTIYDTMGVTCFELSTYE